MSYALHSCKRALSFSKKALQRKFSPFQNSKLPLVQISNCFHNYFFRLASTLARLEIMNSSQWSWSCSIVSSLLVAFLCPMPSGLSGKTVERLAIVISLEAILLCVEAILLCVEVPFPKIEKNLKCRSFWSLPLLLGDVTVRHQMARGTVKVSQARLSASKGRNLDSWAVSGTNQPRLWQLPLLEPWTRCVGWYEPTKPLTATSPQTATMHEVCCVFELYEFPLSVYVVI